ncbi:hypothetical protein K504DRAFT_534372 [Pleomassaria siparia CBS 279.74]|uniref:Uncharacterized protein n=1 Tax=Pleomassaria siparia CBS 279.74 TaxID=1314801 RepID=A0A6G1K7K4_9PLEO|nr:hypothetical protein K504DRAFT_534372 [Pleomassaria siparia CBS 279.74]
MPVPKVSQSPPYRPTIWALGGQAEAKVDIPITAVFLILFIVGAIIHMSIFQRNNKRGHKFVFSILLCGFCISGVMTTILRIASISTPTNIHLAIAAPIFVASGVVLIFVINLVWAQRIVRSFHPRVGWHPATSIILKVLIVCIIFTLIIVITARVQSFYTLQPRTKKVVRDLQIFGTLFLAIISFLPIPITILAVVCGTSWPLAQFRSNALTDGVMVTVALPQKSPPDKFGHGRLRSKILILLTGSTLLCLGATYRCGTLWLPPVPRSQPLPSYFHRASFYIFNFVAEILTVYLYAIVRVDLMFHVPDGSHGSYNPQQQQPLATIRSDVESRGAGQESKYVLANNFETETRIPTSPAVQSLYDSNSDITALPPIPTPLLPIATPRLSLRNSRMSFSKESTLGSLRKSQTRKKRASTATQAEKRVWRKSEQERIIKRLGGPWEKLTES